MSTKRERKVAAKAETARRQEHHMYVITVGHEHDAGRVYSTVLMCSCGDDVDVDGYQPSYIADLVALHLAETT